MINRGASMYVVQRILDHTSPEMTQHYARIQDETVRREWERWQQTRVNNVGEQLAAPATEDLSDAEWMRENLSRAKQALPNGYCGLPLVQTCPHPNACLSCSNFITDASFRGIHSAHLEETDRLIDRAEEAGSDRQVQILKKDRYNLIRIIDGMDRLLPLLPSDPPSTPSK